VLAAFRRHPILGRVLLLVVSAALSYGAIFWTLAVEHVPQDTPWVEVVTTRCLDADGIPVGEEFGEPCPSGTTVDRVEIQSHLPTPP
jgi:hypothetical protein